MNWWTVLAGFLGAVLGGVVAPSIAGRYSRQATAQRELAGRREEWGRRFCFAAELVVRDAEPARRLGVAILTSLADSDLAGRDEVGLIYAATETLAERDTPGDTGLTEQHLYAVRNDEGGDDDHDRT